MLKKCKQATFGAPGVACLVVFLLGASGVGAVRAADTQPSQPSPPPPVLQGDASAMMEFFKFEGEAKKKFYAGVEAWHQAIIKIQMGVQAQIDETNGKIRAAQAAGDKAKEKALEEERAKLQQQYKKERGEARLKIIETLSPEQLSQWMTELLRRRVEFAVKDGSPTPAQMDAIRAICAQEIEQTLKDRPMWVREDPYFFSIREHVGAVVQRVFDEVLTEDQAGRVVRPGKMRGE
jgi:hypothetical protein